jgi:hypothetical protein
MYEHRFRITKRGPTDLTCCRTRAIRLQRSLLQSAASYYRDSVSTAPVQRLLQMPPYGTQSYDTTSVTTANQDRLQFRRWFVQSAQLSSMDVSQPMQTRIQLPMFTMTSSIYRGNQPIYRLSNLPFSQEISFTAHRASIQYAGRGM